MLRMRRGVTRSCAREQRSGGGVSNKATNLRSAAHTQARTPTHASAPLASPLHPRTAPAPPFTLYILPFLQVLTLGTPLTNPDSMPQNPFCFFFFKEINIVESSPSAECEWRGRQARFLVLNTLARTPVCALHVIRRACMCATCDSPRPRLHSRCRCSAFRTHAPCTREREGARAHQAGTRAPRSFSPLPVCRCHGHL